MPTIVRRNERSWAISMISDINQTLRDLDLTIARAGGETTVSTGLQSMFPDVLLYGDEAQTQILQGWELKLPNTPITDTAFIKDAQRKAAALGLDSCFLWNFNAGALYVRDAAGRFNIAKQWNETNHIRTRADVQRFRADWLPLIQNILLQINEFFLRGEIRGANLGEIVSDSVAAAIIERNKEQTAAELQRAAAGDAVVGAKIDIWWNEIRDEFVRDEEDKFQAYAKVLLLNWTNRIFFAHLIKSRYNAAMLAETLDNETTPGEADAVFQEITRRCDFYPIFRGMELCDLLPQTAWQDLLDLNGFLKENGARQIAQTSLQTILENTVAMAKRQLNGQFTTPAELAELLVRLTVRNWHGSVIDPCCGTGTIAKAALTLKKEKTGDNRESVETTWAADKFTFPLQIASLSLTDADAVNLPCRIFQHNALSLSPGEKIPIVDPRTGEPVEYALPLFDAAVSNLPFVPFEKIGAADRRRITDLGERLRSAAGAALSGRSDYYAYIVFSLLQILKPGGRLGMITSNSWLGTAAGREFFHALNACFQVDQLHISNAGRWFNNAKVITVIAILTKRERIAAQAEAEQTFFCTWNRSLAALAEDGDARDLLVNSALLKRELDRSVISMKAYSSAQIRALETMNVSLAALFHQISWLLELRDKLTPICEEFGVIRGERRGWDAMFYPESGHGIEPEYLKKVLKNARALDSLIAAADHDAFCCSSSVERLQAEGSRGALAWIARFQNGVNQTGRPLPEVLARANRYWYEMRDANTADFVTAMNPGRRLFFAKFDRPSFINQRLIGLKAKTAGRDLDLDHALLNSLLGMFYIEAVGFGRGQGALDINSKTIRSAYMLNPRLITDKQRDGILERFSRLLNREILPTEEELARDDRQAFEREVLNAYGIGEYYAPIRDSLLSMQQMRLNV